MSHFEQRSTRWRTGVPAMALALAAIIASSVLAAPTGLVKLNGDAIAEADLSERTVVAIFWASWSPRCRDIVERINDLESRWGDRARIVAVNFQEDAAAVRDFIGDKELRADVFLDPDGVFSKDNSITALPGMLVLVDGRTVFRGRLTRDPSAVLSQALE